LIHIVTTGDLVRSEELTRRDLEDATRTNPAWIGLSHIMHGLVCFYAGDWPSARSAFAAADRVNFASFADRFYLSVGLLASAYAGEGDALDRLLAAEAELDEMPEEMPLGFWEQALAVVEGLATLRHEKCAANLYPRVLKGIGNGNVLSYTLRLSQMLAGIAAAAAGHSEAAREHFETALTQAEALPHRVAQPEVRRWYAWMLLGEKNGDRTKAHMLLHEAMEMYQGMAMPRHLEMARELWTSSQ
jgi:tetratricopeptide (TPR) repeat protein